MLMAPASVGARRQIERGQGCALRPSIGGEARKRREMQERAARCWKAEGALEQGH
jgi:hypothetical protein